MLNRLFAFALFAALLPVACGGDPLLVEGQGVVVRVSDVEAFLDREGSGYGGMDHELETIKANLVDEAVFPLLLAMEGSQELADHPVISKRLSLIEINAVNKIFYEQLTDDLEMDLVLYNVRSLVLVQGKVNPLTGDRDLDSAAGVVADFVDALASGESETSAFDRFILPSSLQLESMNEGWKSADLLPVEIHEALKEAGPGSYIDVFLPLDNGIQFYQVLDIRTKKLSTVEKESVKYLHGEQIVSAVHGKAVNEYLANRYDDYLYTERYLDLGRFEPDDIVYAVDPGYRLSRELFEYRVAFALAPPASQVYLLADFQMPLWMTGDKLQEYVKMKILPEALLYNEALKAGVHESAVYLDHVERVKEQFFSKAMKQYLATLEFPVLEGEVRRWYEEHTHEFFDYRADGKEPVVRPFNEIRDLARQRVMQQKRELFISSWKESMLAKYGVAIDGEQLLSQLSKRKPGSSR
jgi:hypothetical protein